MTHSRLLRRAALVAALVLVLTTGGLTWRWSTGRHAAVVAAALPPQPDLTGWTPDLTRRVKAAVARAQTGNAAALGELSALYHANGFLGEAQACYLALEKLQPDEPRWWHRHATILSGYGELEPAVRCAERVVELAPDYIPGYVRLADIWQKLNRFERAATLYEHVLRQGDHPHALLGLARLDIERGNWSEARARLERVVTQTNFTLGYDLIVTVYEQLGLAAEAARIRGRAKASGAYRDLADPWMDELIHYCFDPYQLSLTAGVALRAGGIAPAMQLLQRAVLLSPEDVGVRFQLAQTLAQQRDFKGAREQFERCTKIAPDFADAWSHLAALLDETGDRGAAERSVDAGLQHNPESSGLHLMRARFHRQAGKIPAAVASYRRSLQLRPNEAEPYVELATLLLQGGGTTEALQHLHHALAVEPDFPNALTLLALTSIAASDEAGARRWLHRVQSQPRVPPEQTAQLLAVYKGQFGREFRNGP